MTTSSISSTNQPVAATAVSPASLSSHQMEAKIRALTAEKIELISEKMAEKIVNQLGPLKVARINAQVIKAKVPLSEMFGYVTQLRSLSSGRATSTMEFSHYSPAPSGIAEEVIAKVKGKVNA